MKPDDICQFNNSRKARGAFSLILSFMSLRNVEPDPVLSGSLIVSDSSFFSDPFNLFHYQKFIRTGINDGQGSATIF